MATIVRFLTVSLLFFLGSVVASPTSNEFEACERLAVFSLQGCLDLEKNVKNSQCWQQSKRDYEQCRKRVISRHLPPTGSDLKKLEKRKKLEAEAKLKMESENNNR
ncbi:hypothetical protein [Aliivibrio kagoshimensis]|uniref:hypothetical protein n=1 Tax=Aliivibrio kagoshimensis TaxID=2910230 RepID=UPI003D1413CF